MIEIAYTDFIYQYKLNEFCPTELLARKNKAYARWYVHSRYRTQKEALEAMFALERAAKESKE